MSKAHLFLFLTVILLATISSGNIFAEKISQPIGKIPSKQIPVGFEKIDSDIAQLIKGGTLSSRISNSTQLQLNQIASDKIDVYIYLNSKLDNLPVNIPVISRADDIIFAKLSASQINSLSGLENVKRIGSPIKAVFYNHAVSQGVNYALANKMHDAGYTGTGVTIAVIDAGFLVANPEISSNIVGSWKAPGCADIACGSIEGTSHGTAVAEIVVDMAPNVKLRVYAIQNSIDFSNAVSDAIANNVDVITASLGFPGSGGDGTSGFFRDGTSPVAKNVNQAKAAGILVTVAAGNSGTSHWKGTYSASPSIATSLGLVGMGYQSVNVFNSTASGNLKACLPVTDFGSQYVASWNAWATTNQDYDLFLYDSSMSTRVGDSIGTQSGTQSPVETIPQGLPVGSACLVLASWSSTQNHLFHIDAVNNSIDPSMATRGGSISTPADASGALSIGAVNQATDALESFSSSGPTDDSRLKPEICGPDNVLSHQYGVFPGTSASTPHVAGAAALLLQQNPSLTVDQLRQKLIDYARFNASYSVNNLCGNNSGSLFLQDAIPPNVSITSNLISGSTTTATTLNYTATFSKSVFNFTANDITVTGTANATHPAVSNFVPVNDTVYTFKVLRGSSDGTAIVSVLAGKATDAATNQNTASNTYNLTIDSTAPTVVLSTPKNPTHVSPFTVTAQFSEIVTGVEIGDYTVVNGTTSGFVSLNATTFTVQVTPTLSHITINMPFSAATDTAGNPSTAAHLEVTFDNTPPTVVLSTLQNPTHVSPFTVTAKFSEIVTGVDTADLMVVGGTKSNFVAINGDTYTVDVTPTINPIIINMASSAASDMAGNNNTAANQLSVTYSIQSTTASGTLFDDTNGNGIQDIGEFGISGRTIILVDGNGTRLADKTTDVNGSYTFTGMAPGTLLIQTAPVPQNHLPSTGFNSYFRPTIISGSNTTINFPMTPITTQNRATVNGTVFEDTNNNGVQDNSEPGLAGVQVFVVDFLTLTQTTVLTNANGTYTATGILPDVVLVQAAPIPAGHLPSTGHFTYSYQTLAQGSTTTVNFALKPITPLDHGTIMIDVFNDTNSNGIRDINESRVLGATVFTFELLTAQANVQVTDFTGVTTHSGLIPDVVLAQINAAVLPPGFSGITSANGGFEFIPVTPNSTTTVKIGLH
ncbi:MAG: S8 family serine peptidase [Nitrosopumilus sp.]|nr:S8 family serine peptidase [Nitrosopumilus sp.]